MNCSICYNDITDTNKVITECNHIFHFTCLLKNYKNNHSTGDQFPLCRKVFLQMSNNANTYSSLVNLRSVIEIIRQRLHRPTSPPPPRNQIIRQINRRRQISRIGRVRRQARVRPTPRHQQIRTEIEELSFVELKDRLRSEGLSTRGYVRANLEKRLFNKLIQQQ